MLQCLGMCLDMLLQVYVTVYRSMCLDMLLQVYVTVYRYVFGYVVTGLCYSV